MPEHLWEIEHPDRCEAGNWFHSGEHQLFLRWQDFRGEYTAGPDEVLLFRWDWKRPCDSEGEPSAWKRDEYYRESDIRLFFVNQGKARNWSVDVQVCRADESEIREWLATQYEYVKRLWYPFAPVPEGDHA